MNSNLIKETFFFFWKKDSPFSQWYLSDFEGISDFGGGMETFSCAEQWMMYNKALLFKDIEVAKEILCTSNAKTMKTLGRQVKNFDPNIWDKHKIEIVRQGTILKFSQNSELSRILKNTKGTLVEASPFDKIWGIGLRSSDPKAKQRETWKGSNLLGQILTEVRDTHF